MYAPSDGVVVHANRYSSRGGSAEFVVEAGATVRERQAIIRLPDPSQMQVKAKINESRIALISEGMPCKIEVSSLADVELMGRVTKVNRYAEPSSFFTSSIKEYACSIEIVDPPESIRTGMTAEVQIFVQQIPDAVQIPIQAVYEHGGRTFSLVKKNDENFDTREVIIGATNDQMAAIEEGVTEGEEVVINLRQHLNLMSGLPKISDSSNVGLAAAVAKKTGKPTGTNQAEGDASESERPGGGPARQNGRGGGGRPEGGGRPGGDGPPGGAGSGGGGGGPPSPEAIAQRIFDENDTDKDGSLSKAEISSMSGRRQETAKSADTDGDGNVTRAELTGFMKKRMAEFSGGSRPRG